MAGQWIGTPYLKTELLLMMKDNYDKNKEYNDALWDVFNLIVKIELEKTRKNLEA